MAATHSDREPTDSSPMLADLDFSPSSSGHMGPTPSLGATDADRNPPIEPSTGHEEARTGPGAESETRPASKRQSSNVASARSARSSSSQHRHGSSADSGKLEKNLTTTYDPPRRRTRVWWILSLYIPLLVLPWILTCVMNYRPLTAPRYVDPTGRITARDFDINEKFQVAINVMNSVAAVLTVPVTSLILAEAAVIWLQREDGCRSRVPLSHFYDIADRGWTDVPTVWNAITNPDLFNGFLVKSAAALVFCAVILPLQQLLVHTETMQVITCSNVPYPARSCGYHDAYIAKTPDAQIGRIKVLPLWDVKELVNTHLTYDTGMEPQPGIWSVENDNYIDPSSNQIGGYYDLYGSRDWFTPFWVSAVANGTSTGVLPQHALRLNSSVSCERFDFEQLPGVCPGVRPFTARFQASRDPTARVGGNASDFDIQVCVPGSFVDSPWTLSRDAQTISEEMFFGLNVKPGAASLIDPMFGESSFAFHCTANTTRGYFELPNEFNNHTPGPLLQEFPRGKEIEKYNDYEEGNERSPPYMEVLDTGDYETMAPVPYSDAPSDYRPPFTASSDYFDYFKAPGPLALSAVALFGNESHFAAAQRASALNDTATSRSLCDTARLPFASIARLANTVQGHSCSASVAADPAWAAATQLLWWFQSFNSTDAFPPTALGFATFYANDALLALASLGNDVFHRRVVYASDGRTTQKPRVPLPALVALSVLLLAEVVGLLGVAYYAWKTPTWTDTFKSATVARLANAMERDTLPPAGWHGEDHQAVFERLEGRIGVAVRPGEDGEGEVRQLVHGGSEALNPPTGKRKRAAHISFRRRGQRGAG